MDQDYAELRQEHSRTTAGAPQDHRRTTAGPRQDHPGPHRTMPGPPRTIRISTRTTRNPARTTPGPPRTIGIIDQDHTEPRQDHSRTTQDHMIYRRTIESPFVTYNINSFGGGEEMVLLPRGAGGLLQHCSTILPQGGTPFACGHYKATAGPIQDHTRTTQHHCKYRPRPHGRPPGAP